MILTRRQTGFTLLESMLAIAIASAVIVLSLSTWQSHERNLQLESLQYNVDTIFNGMRMYWMVNCQGPGEVDPTTGNLINPGTLHPYAIPAPDVSVPKVLSLQNDLVTPNFLALQNLRPNNNFVDNSSDISATSYSGYLVQFNPTELGNLSYNACTSPTNCTQISSTSATSTPPSPPRSQAEAIIWMPQVAVKLNADLSAADANALRDRLGADCVSDLKSGYIEPCSTPPTAGGYLVWQRLPSFASPHAVSPLWQSLPLVKQFNLQYTHDQFFELNNGFRLTQFYVCGG